jgi:hypothetical protein
MTATMADAFAIDHEENRFVRDVTLTSHAFQAVQQLVRYMLEVEFWVLDKFAIRFEEGSRSGAEDVAAALKQAFPLMFQSFVPGQLLVAVLWPVEARVAVDRGQSFKREVPVGFFGEADATTTQDAAVRSHENRTTSYEFSAVPTS